MTIRGLTRMEKDVLTMRKTQNFAANYLSVSMQILTEQVQNTFVVSVVGEDAFVRRRVGNFHAYLLAPTPTQTGQNQT